MGSGNWADLAEVWEGRQDRKWESFSWLTVRALLSSVNDVIGKGAPRLLNDLRGAWVARQSNANSHGRWNDDLVIRMRGTTSFLLLGDPGEQDFSQYAVVPVLASQDDAGFMVVLSDVIYPSGDVNDYVDGFYIPYRALQMPIYALPGNHDWYDGLNGFMWNFCGAEPLPPDAYDTASYRPRERVARRIWKKASAPRRDVLNAYRNERVGNDSWEALQPGPYYAIETDDVFVVCVDSGITGDIDRAQAEWLVRVSESTTKPKVMLVGRPLVDKKCHKRGPFPDVPGLPVEGSDGRRFASVDEVARHKAYGYVAAIGGDTHNYQRYDVTLREEDGTTRPFNYIVSGGGGAYMSATHTIVGADTLQFEEGQEAAAAAIQLDRFESYPSRVESLRYFAELVVPRLWRLVVRVALAMLGIAVAAAAVLTLDVDAQTLEELLTAAAALIGVGLFLVLFRPGPRRRSTEPTRQRRGLTYVGSFVLGAVLGLSAWWLSAEHFGKHMIVIAAVAAVAGLIAQLLRKTGIWRTKWISIAFLVAQPVAALAALRLFVLNDANAVQVGVMAAAVIVLPVSLLMVIDRLRALFPSRYKLLLLIGLLGLTALAAWRLDETWGRAVAAAAVIAVIGLLITVFAHLHFLNAFSLFYRPSMHDGTLSVDEARHVLDWRAPGGGQPSDARTRRIGNMVHPGSEKPHGPLHRFISEIFDKDDRPLLKNFLRVDVGEGKLTITCYHATGEETGPGDVTWEEPIVISLPGAEVA